MALEAEEAGRSRGVQSVEVAVAVLRALAAAGGPVALSDLAARVGMPPAKVHRYMASLVDAGVAVHRRSGAYDLGPVAAEIGMAGVARLDVVNRAADALPVLVEDTGITAHLTVWGTGGPTVVRWERARRPLVTAIGVGTVLPVRRTATGRAFAAHLPWRVVAARLLEEAPDESWRPEDFPRHPGGIYAAERTFIPGLVAIARPVLDLSGQAAAVVTMVSTDPAILDLDGPAARRLATFT